MKKQSEMPGLGDEVPRGRILIFVVAGLVFAGLVDFTTGDELRVFPLYFLPVGLASWRLGKSGAIAGAVVSTCIWSVSNWLAGMQYSSSSIWIVNIAAQFSSFGTVSALLWWARTILEREKNHALSDSLTGLPNGRAFYQFVFHCAAGCRRHNRPMTLAYIDIDNFKCVNDRHGHSRGDELLREVAAFLRQKLRATDKVARIGGDEFVVCLPETSGSLANALLGRLRIDFEEKLRVEGCSISASIGAVSWAVPPSSVDEMISAADKVMYDVKRGGKNHVVVVEVSSSEGFSMKQ